MTARKQHKGLDKFQYALVASGRQDMMRWLRSKKKAKLLLHEIHKEIFELGPPTPPGKPIAYAGGVLTIPRASPGTFSIHF